MTPRLPPTFQLPPRAGPTARHPLAWLRWPLRVLLLPAAWVEQVAAWVSRNWLHRSWRLAGRCHQTGACCHHILAELPVYIERVPALRWLTLAWLTHVQDFFVRSFEAELPDGGMALVLGCRNLDGNGRCAHHFLRPTVCRLYPYRTNGPPHLLPGCGFHPRNEGPRRLNILP